MMKKSAVTGHRKNIYNFEQLIQYCNDLKDQYKPARKDLTIASMNKLHHESIKIAEAVEHANTSCNKAVKDRRVAYKSLNQLMTRVYNAVIASGGLKKTIASARALKLKMAGKPTQQVKKKKRITRRTKVEKVKKTSNTKLSFKYRAAYFYKMIVLLKSMHEYTPNERELTIEKLKLFHEKLEAHNEAVFSTSVNRGIACDERNKILYDAGSSLISTAANVKRYIRSLFGASSKQYKAISKLVFKKIKRG